MERQRNQTQSHKITPDKHNQTSLPSYGKIFTAFCHVWYLFIQYMCEVTKYREYGETSEQTCQTVANSYNKSVPVNKTHRWNERCPCKQNTQVERKQVALRSRLEKGGNFGGLWDGYLLPT